MVRKTAPGTGRPFPDTVERLRAFKIKNIITSHCTGWPKLS